MVNIGGLTNKHISGGKQRNCFQFNKDGNIVMVWNMCRYLSNDLT